MGTLNEYPKSNGSGSTAQAQTVTHISRRQCLHNMYMFLASLSRSMRQSFFPQIGQQYQSFFSLLFILIIPFSHGFCKCVTSFLLVLFPLHIPGTLNLFHPNHPCNCQFHTPQTRIYNAGKYTPDMFYRVRLFPRLSLPLFKIIAKIIFPSCIFAKSTH